MRVLVVEDEVAVANFIRQGLTEASYAVDVASDGQEALDYVSTIHYDVIVLDIMLPKMDGLSVLRKLRDMGSQASVLLLTARDAVEDRVEGLDTGADDYLVKPFAFSELLARIRALLRRPALQSGTILSAGDLQMDLAHREVQRAGRRIELSPREFALLEFLMRHPNQVVSRTQLMQHVWNFDFYGDSNIVDVYIGYLRRKVDQESAYPIIHTVWGVGYRLSTEAKKDA
jgi:DNA-binding response OmpR family regulator